jgi:hypothetical protein
VSLSCCTAASIGYSHRRSTSTRCRRQPSASPKPSVAAASPKPPMAAASVKTSEAASVEASVAASVAISVATSVAMSVAALVAVSVEALVSAPMEASVAASVEVSVAASVEASVVRSAKASAEAVPSVRPSVEPSVNPLVGLSAEMQALMGLHVGSTCHILANQDSSPEQYFCAASMLWGLDHFAWRCLRKRRGVRNFVCKHPRRVCLQEGHYRHHQLRFQQSNSCSAHEASGLVDSVLERA